MYSDSGSSGFASFIPLLIMLSIFAIFAYFLGKRKGKNPITCLLLCFVPILNAVYLFYLASLTEKDVLERLEHLESLLKVPQKAAPGESS
jgi:hypothetical protein